MSTRFLTCCPDGQPLQAPREIAETIFMDEQLVLIRVQGTCGEGMEQTLSALGHRPASMEDLWVQTREGWIEPPSGLDVPLACLGSIWTDPRDGAQFVPYLVNASDPLDPNNWRLRRVGRSFGPHWRFAVWERWTDEHEA